MGWICEWISSVFEQLRRRGFLGCGRRRWSHKFGVVYRNILLKLFHLNGELVSRPRKGPAKRDFHSIGITIVRVINLCRVAAERRFRVADETQQKARLLVKVEAERRL